MCPSFGEGLELIQIIKAKLCSSKNIIKDILCHQIRQRYKRDLKKQKNTGNFLLAFHSVEQEFFVTVDLELEFLVIIFLQLS